MVGQYKAALESLWRDRCWIYQRVGITDPDTHLTEVKEELLLEDQPCKLSFETLSAAGTAEPAAGISQVVKLFISPDVKVPAGCKVVVKRYNQVERTFHFASSSEAGVFSNHQEIVLHLWKGYA